MSAALCIEFVNPLAALLYDVGLRVVARAIGEPAVTASHGAPLSKCDGKCALAMIVTIVRGDRFCEGLLLSYLENGMMLKWMKMLKEIDGE